ncbi:sodium/hydrogen exchanger family protein [Sulfuriferula plumbiphila]|uniref:Sodium/hydrogen exchanger family protein n=1 Tax=Sulfuriferula plumbiphila TaxID=171865 RepID=A0A512L995_9PROT|nr:monovalent cation:proton antiporter-2 (CPA2) family protein [Sulfuriferula plumbiphila]BBP05581.1 sodium/hydrogen exchanger family protein [Sulfuriferula plumbiphila]GEP30711.1 sodium/hydrogen exchanger family protein [Sulfuriferula plumbiphila]
MHTTLGFVLILLAAAVIVSALFRALRLPSMLGYLLVGILVSPHAFGWIPDSQDTRHLAEFGVVFMMFSIGLEFSLPKLKAIRTTVFGFGGAQVVASILLVMAVAWGAGLPWAAGFALGGALAMSSTAIVSKMLAERLELQSQHGRQMIAVLLFQDLAVVPLLILIPTLAAGSENLWVDLGWAGAKAAVVLFLLLVVGQKLMRPWFSMVAGHKSSELFMLNVLLITLGLAYLTDQAGLSLALGAFLAGMLISETEFRYQVEDDIKPFRDVLLGLFFVTIGMLLDLHAVWVHLGWVVLVLAALVLLKAALVWGLGRMLGNEAPVAMRTALGLAQGGEFGFVLLAQAGSLNLIQGTALQIVLAAMVLSMMIAPVVIQYTDAITRRLCGGEWAGRARELHDIAVKSFAADAHLIICGYGRSGQSLARLLESEDIPYIALDVDTTRVKAAAAAGENVVFGDAARREVLKAVGLNRARALVVTFANLPGAMKILAVVQELRPDLPVIVRTVDDTDLNALKQAGAAEVVPEVLEGSLMLASHALLLLGVPLTRVLKKLRGVREQRYGLLRGFFRGATDEEAELSETAQPRLLSVLITEQAAAAGKTLAETGVLELGVEVIVVRRRNIRGLDPQPETQVLAGDVLVLRGIPENLAAAEIRLLQG